MRVVSAALDAEVAGTTQGDFLDVSAWRGGALVAANLDITSWSLNWDISRQVQGQGTLTVANPDSRLAPWSLSDPLGPGGSRVSIAWVSGSSGIRVPLASWRIRKTPSQEAWRVYNTSAGPVRVAGGASVTVQIEEDLSSTASICRLDGESVPAGAGVYAEIRRLLQDYGAVDTSAAPADATVQPTYTYAVEGDRLAAVGDLLDMIYAVARIGPDGALQVIPAAGVGPVWTIQGGDEGALVTLSREISDAGTYNEVVSKGTTVDGLALVGRVPLTTGPLAFGGPFGKVPTFHSAIAQTQAGVDADAATMLATQTAAGTVDLSVTCLAHPGIQPHDIVTVLAPTAVGDIPLTGRVVAMRWSSAQSDAGTTPSKTMSLTVRVSIEVLAAVAAAVQHG